MNAASPIPATDSGAVTEGRQTRSYLGLLATTLACLLAVLFYFLSASHRQALQDAEVTTRNLVQVIESQVHGDFERATAILDFIAAEVSPAQMEQTAVPAHAATLSARLVRLLDKFPQVSVVNLFDARGNLLYSSNPATRHFGIADRPFFAPLRDDPKAVFIFSDAQISRSIGHWALVINRSIRDKAGRFKGITSAVIDLSDYTELFAAINVGAGGVTLIRRSDNFKLLLRSPPGDVKYLNQSLPKDNLIRQRIDAGERKGTQALTASTDGVRRMASFRQLDGYPFYVQVALAESDYLAAWRKQATIAATLTLLFVLIFGWVIVRALKVDSRTRVIARRLAQREALFSALFEQSSFLAGVLDGTGHLLEVNGRAMAVIGGQKEAVLGRYFPDTPWWSRAEDKAALKQLLSAAAEGRPGSIEVEHKLAGGGTITVLFHAIPVRAEQESLTAVSGVDISGFKQAEAELRRSNGELEQFSYSISHDMRQPLRMISSYLKLLEMGLSDQLDGEKREYFNFAIDGAQRLDQMLIGLLDYSRVGRKGEPPAWIDSRAVLDEALLFLQPAIAEAQAVVRIEGEWPRILVRPDEMLRLVQNLMANALKFRIAGRPPEISASSEIIGNTVGNAVAKPLGQAWRLSVSDNGIGIAPGQIGRLFQVFQRLQSRAAYEGTGIGLALCRKIAEHQNGRIWVESAGEGLGARFVVEIPLANEVAP